MNWLRELFGGREKDELESEMEALLAKQTGDPAYLHRTRWVTAYGRKDYKTALAELAQALRLVPGSAIYLALRGMTHWTMGNRRAAYADWDAAQRSNPTQKEVADLHEILMADVRECRDRARRLAANGSYQQCLAELNQALESDPENAATLFFRGMIQAKVENLNAAISDVSHALDLDPGCGDGQGTTGRQVLQSLQNMARRRAA